VTVIAGVDVGGTKTSAVLLGEDRALAAVTSVPTDASGPGGVYESTTHAIEELAAAGSVLRLDALGIGIAGLVDNRRGTVNHAVNLGINDVPLEIGSLLADRFGTVTNVENDVNASALGAYVQMSASEEIDDLAYLSIGTGIAAGVVLNGRLHRGRRGVAGEIGHLPVAAGGPECACGLRGCLEAVASGRAIERAWPVAAGRNSATELFAASRRDEAAARVAGEIADHLAGAILLLAVTYDAERVVLGGGVAEARTPLREAVDDGLRRLERRSAFVRALELPARLRLCADEPIGAIGAAVAAAGRLPQGTAPRPRAEQ